MRDELAAAGIGVVVLTSSSGRELARESLDWKHGAFTMAALESLQGKADTDGDTWLSVSELEGYVVRRVRELTGNEQNPRISVLGEHAFESRLFMAAGEPGVDADLGEPKRRPCGHVAHMAVESSGRLTSLSDGAHLVLIPCLPASKAQIGRSI